LKSEIMWKRRFVLLLMMLALCVFGSCDQNGAEETAADERVDKKAGRVGQDTMTESDLENTIRARLNNDSQFKDANLDVNACFSRNEVTISGVVEIRGMRDRAIELAAAARPGILVNNRMQVRPRAMPRSEYTEENAREEREMAREHAETIGDSLDDAWIHMRITASLIANQDALRRKINVGVRDNVVTLRGVVGTAEQKAGAEQLAKETESVKRVVNQLKVEKASGKSLGAG